jgi:hypothetical protein
VSRLIRPPKPPRSPFAPRLSPEQEAARLAQAKADRRKIQRGLILRARTPTKFIGQPVWTGLKPKGLSPRQVFTSKLDRLVGEPS